MRKKIRSNIIKTIILTIIGSSLLYCNKNNSIGPTLDLGKSEVFSNDAVIQSNYSIKGEIRTPLIDAINTWNIKLGRPLLNYDMGNFPIYVKWVEKLSDGFDKDVSVYGITYRYHDKCIIEILNKPKRFDFDIYLVSMHEIGHCLGFMHSINKKSIMYVEMSKDVRFTKDIIDIINSTNVSIAHDRNAPK